jgi:uroporphyrinogen-III synthase
MLHKRPRILFTRAIAQPVIDRAAQHGIDIRVIPFIRTAPLEPAEVSRIVGRPGRGELVAVFTSVHAVRAVAPVLNGMPLKIFCLSGATRGAVAEHFPAADVLGTAAYAEGLAAKILEDKAVRQLHYFCGNLHLPLLPDQMAAAGIRMDLHIVYETRLTPVALDEAFDGIAFFSPSAVQSYLSVNQVAAGVCLFAIGRTTAAALSALDNELIISSFPDPEAMLDTIIEFYQSGSVLTNTSNA